MSKDVFLGILQGLMGAREQEQQNLLSQEMSRRKLMADFWLKQSENPNIRPEAQDVAIRKYMAIADTPYNKKLDKTVESLDDFLQVPTGVGQPSWLGGETTRQVAAQPMPLPGMAAAQAPGAPQLSPVGPGLPFGGAAQNEPEPRMPLPPTAFTVPQPSPPPEFRLPARFTEQERFAQARRVGEFDLEQTRRKAEIEAEIGGRYAPPITKIVGDRTVQWEPNRRTWIDIGPAERRADTALSEFEVWVAQNPGRPVEDYSKMRYPHPDTSMSEAEFFLKDPKGYEDYLKLRRQYAPPTQAPATVQIDRTMTETTRDMPPEIRDAVNRVAIGMNAPGSRLQFARAVEDMFARGDMRAVRDTIKQAAVQTEPVAARTGIQGRRAATAALRDIRELLKGVPTNLLVGGVENALRALGATKDPAYVHIAARLGLLRQNYRRAMTGAQFSIPEAQEYARQFPDIGNLDVVNTALMDAMVDAFLGEDDVYWRYKLSPEWADRFDPLPGVQGTGSTGGAAPPSPPPGTDPGGAVEEWERGPDGKLRRKPPGR